MLFVVFFSIVFGIRLLCDPMDRSRIRIEVETKGGVVSDIRWNPFGPGWFGDNIDRIYEVDYTDNLGNGRQAYVKTSMWSGVYFTKDQIIRPTSRSSNTLNLNLSEVEKLKLENEKLKKELDTLKTQILPGKDS